MTGQNSRLKELTFSPVQNTTHIFTQNLLIAYLGQKTLEYSSGCIKIGIGRNKPSASFHIQSFVLDIHKPESNIPYYIGISQITFSAKLKT